MNPVPEIIEVLGLTGVWTYLVLFLGVTILMIWRFEALLDHGLEGTALGTLVMPYCSGLGNLFLVLVVLQGGHPAGEILSNALVNNVTNLTLVLGFVALFWRLSLQPAAGSGRGRAPRRSAGAETARRLNRLSLMLTLAAGIFFSGVTWALGADGRIDRNDGIVLTALFLFWQCFQVFDVLKHNVRRRHSFSLFFYMDLAVIAVGAFVLYSSIDWLVDWLTSRSSGFLTAEHLGWLSGWLMVVPNALLALYYAARGRSDVVYASQIGDGHICIPLCIGLTSLWQPVTVPSYFNSGLGLLVLGFAGHALFLQFTGGLPRWIGWVLLVAYAWFVVSGLS